MKHHYSAVLELDSQDVSAPFFCSLSNSRDGCVGQYTRLKYYISTNIHHGSLYFHFQLLHYDGQVHFIVVFLFITASISFYIFVYLSIILLPSAQSPCKLFDI